MKRKTAVMEWAPILYDRGWSTTIIGELFGVSGQRVRVILFEYGLHPRRCRKLSDAMSRLEQTDPLLAVALRKVANTQPKDYTPQT